MKTVHGAAVKPQKEDVYKFGGNFEPHQLGKVRRAVRCEGSVSKNGAHDDAKLEEIGVEKVMWVMRAWLNDEERTVEVHVDSGCANGSERKWTS